MVAENVFTLCFGIIFFQVSAENFLVTNLLTVADILSENNRRKVAGWTILFTCVGAFILTYSASSLGLPG